MMHEPEISGKLRYAWAYPLDPDILYIQAHIPLICFFGGCSGGTPMADSSRCKLGSSALPRSTG
jgi:hypothetical protein